MQAPSPLGGDGEDEADELAMEIPAHSIEALASRRASLQINTPHGNVHIDNESMAQISEKGIDLYLRIVPVTDEEKQQTIQDESFYSFIYQSALAMILLTNKRLEKFLNIRTLC